MTRFNPVPDTGPWDVLALRQTPAVEIRNARQVQDGDRPLTLAELYYTGEPWLDRPTRVFGYYARPSLLPADPLPAMVLIHGGGGTASPEWARHWAYRGYAALAMDLYGKGPKRERLPDGGVDWSDLEVAFRYSAGIRNGWIYQAVANVIHSVSALCSLPEVDGKRVGVTGFSWGGNLACFAMSLDDRLALAAPAYGFGFTSKLGMPPNPTEADRELIALVRANFEPGLYLPRCTLPVLWVTNTSETYDTLESLRQSYLAARGPRTLSVTVSPSHGDPQRADFGFQFLEVDLFADSIFRGTAGLATVTEMEVLGQEVRVRYQSEVPLHHTVIHWTTELDQPWPQRRWQSAFAAITREGEIQADLPLTRPAVAFLTLTDWRWAVTSTEHVQVE